MSDIDYFRNLLRDPVTRRSFYRWVVGGGLTTLAASIVISLKSGSLSSLPILAWVMFTAVGVIVGLVGWAHQETYRGIDNIHPSWADPVVAAKEAAAHDARRREMKQRARSDPEAAAEYCAALQIEAEGLHLVAADLRRSRRVEASAALRNVEAELQRIDNEIAWSRELHKRAPPN